MRHIGAFGNLLIYAEDDVAVTPGHQWLWIPAEPGGETLAQLLCPDRSLIEIRPEGWFRIPHNDQVDATLLDLVDLCATIRYRAPELVQLRLLLTAADRAELDVTPAETGERR